MAIKWVFFDIGDVLFNEDAPHVLYFHSMLASLRRNGIDVSWDDYHSRILECVRVSPTTAVADAAHEYVANEGVWNKVFHEGREVYEAIRQPRPYGVLLDNITETVIKIRERFKVGIIANQHPEVLQALDDYGIGGLFDVKIIDQVVGVSKPDPAIFHLALEKGGCEANEAMMVGDRPDSDIAPAKALGLSTVRFRRGLLYTHYDPLSEMERADLEVRELAQLAPAVLQLANAV
jgi:HAD superfamily hydrolase (TIGR01509 family)